MISIGKAYYGYHVDRLAILGKPGEIKLVSLDLV